MELGIPPLYAEVNRVEREMDKNYLEQLGPYVRALREVIQFSEFNK